MGIRYNKKKLLKTIPSKRASLAIELANLIRNNDIENCKQIGINGLKIIEQIYKKKKKPVNILTHCNAGWLATVDYGTALSPIFLLIKLKFPYMCGLMRQDREIKELF